MLQTYHLRECIPRCAQAAAGTHFCPVCLGPGWEVQGCLGKQGACIVRGQGSPLTADRGLEAAGLRRGKQPGNMDKGPWGVA